MPRHVITLFPSPEVAKRHGIEFKWPRLVAVGNGACAFRERKRGGGEVKGVGLAGGCLEKVNMWREMIVVILGRWNVELYKFGIEITTEKVRGGGRVRRKRRRDGILDVCCRRTSQDCCKTLNPSAPRRQLLPLIQCRMCHLTMFANKGVNRRIKPGDVRLPSPRATGSAHLTALPRDGPMHSRG